MHVMKPLSDHQINTLPPVHNTSSWIWKGVSADTPFHIQEDEYRLHKTIVGIAVRGGCLQFLSRRYGGIMKLWTLTAQNVDGGGGGVISMYGGVSICNTTNSIKLYCMKY